MTRMKIKMYDTTGFIYENSIGQRLSIQFGPCTASQSKSDNYTGFNEAEEVEIALLDADGNFIYRPWGYIPADIVPTAMLLFRHNDFANIEKMLKAHSIGQDEQEAYESWDHSDDADALASAGWGTDEDYGDHGCGDD